MNIDDKDVRLKLIASKEPKGGPRVGGRSFATYAAGNLKVRVDFIVTKVCAPNDETCEVTWYNATITVTRDGATARINLKGICGT